MKTEDNQLTKEEYAAYASPLYNEIKDVLVKHGLLMTASPLDPHKTIAITAQGLIANLVLLVRGLPLSDIGLLDLANEIRREILESKK